MHESSPRKAVSPVKPKAAITATAIVGPAEVDTETLREEVALLGDGLDIIAEQENENSNITQRKSVIVNAKLIVRSTPMQEIKEKEKKSKD